jgi:hypothetical protein
MKLIPGVNLGSYTFDASAGTITITGFPTFTIESVLLITNVTDNEVIYQFDLPAKGGTVAGSVITLTYDTSSMSDTDDLMIYIDVYGALLARTSTSDLAELKIDNSGRLLTSPEPPAAGPGETDVSDDLRGDFSAITDSEYTIPSGQTLQIRSLVGAVENNGAGCEFTLYEDPNGDKSVLNLVPDAELIVDGATQQNSISAEYVGDGTRRVVLRAEQLTGGTYRTASSWTGVLQN